MDGHDTGHCFLQLKAMGNRGMGGGGQAFYLFFWEGGRLLRVRWWIARVCYQHSAVDIRGANKITLCFKSDTIILLMSVLKNAHTYFLLIGLAVH